MPIGLTYPALKALSPCAEEFAAVSKALGGAEVWNGNLVTASEAREAGVSFSNVVWAASAVSRKDKEIERRLRLWMADCAVRVLHIFEAKMPNDLRPRQAIEAARAFSNDEIGAAARDAAGAAAGAAARDAARAAARAAAGAAAGAAAWDAAWDAAWAAAWAAAGAAAWAAAEAAARDAEEQWQFTRLCDWLSDTPPAPLELPAIAKSEAA